MEHPQRETLFEAAHPWVFLDANTDPFDDRPADARCDGFRFRAEDSGLEVRTGESCNYVSALQPLAADVDAGDVIWIRIWHGPLESSSVAEAHLALAVGGKPWFQLSKGIPKSPDHAAPSLHEERFLAPNKAAAGSDLVFHLHNHGTNAWNLRELSVER